MAKGIYIFFEHASGINKLSETQKSQLLDCVINQKNVSGDIAVDIILGYILDADKRRADWVGSQEYKEKQRLNGQKGGRPKKPNKPKITQNTQTKPENPPSPSPSPILSDPSPDLKEELERKELEQEEKKKKEEEKRKRAEEKQKRNKEVHDFIVNYCEAYKLKYQVNPNCSGEQAAAAGRIVDAEGVKNAIAYVPYYLDMKDSWFVTKAHDLVCFAGNINKIKIYAQTGKFTTKQQIQTDELRQHNQQAVREALNERK